MQSPSQSREPKHGSPREGDGFSFPRESPKARQILDFSLRLRLSLRGGSSSPQAGEAAGTNDSRRALAALGAGLGWNRMRYVNGSARAALHWAGLWRLMPMSLPFSAQPPAPKKKSFFRSSLIRSYW